MLRFVNFIGGARFFLHLLRVFAAKTIFKSIQANVLCNKLKEEPMEYYYGVNDRGGTVVNEADVR